MEGGRSSDFQEVDARCEGVRQNECHGSDASLDYIRRERQRRARDQILVERWDRDGRKLDLRQRNLQRVDRGRISTTNDSRVRVYTLQKVLEHLLAASDSTTLW